MRKALVLIASGALGLALPLGVAACGGDDELQGKLARADAQTLISDLQEVEANVEVGSCLVAIDRAERMLDDIERLPDSVDEDLRSALQNGASQLVVLLNDPENCERRTETQTETTPTEATETQPTETGPTETETTETQPTETTTTTTTPTETTTTPDGGGGGGGGIGVPGQ